MDPLIITATPNICWLNPDVPYPKTEDELVLAARQCEREGASILHFHAENRWASSLSVLRKNTSMILQCGMSSLPIPERREVFDNKADMISIITSHHDEAFFKLDTYALHTREELEEYARLSRETGVKLEFEIWHTGSIWNLNYLIKKGLVDPPYFTTLFFNWPGGSWSPATLEEYLYRKRMLPDGCIVNISVMGQGQKELLTAAILQGDHVRVGTEDNPYNHQGMISETYELVAEIVEISQALGRPIASPSISREILKL